jgi:hypothetical protein
VEYIFPIQLIARLCYLGFVVLPVLFPGWY